MASGPITSWQIDEETVETVTEIIFLSSKFSAHGDCRHEIIRCLLLEKSYDKLSVLKNRDITFLAKVCIVKTLEKRMTTTPVFLPGKFHRQRSLAWYSPWGGKELDKIERLTFPIFPFTFKFFFFFFKSLSVWNHSFNMGTGDWTFIQTFKRCFNVLFLKAKIFHPGKATYVLLVWRK